MKSIANIAFLLLSILSIAQNKQQDTTKTKLKFFGSFEHNGQWYTNDVNRNITHDSVPLRSNNYINLNANYGRFTAGTQIESYYNQALLNYNPGFIGSDFKNYNSDMSLGEMMKKFELSNLSMYYLNYKDKYFDVTVGHFFEQFGNGLALRAWEDRALGINNAFKGIKVTFKPADAVSITALGGRQKIAKNFGFYTSDSKIYGLNSDVDITQLISVNSFALTYGFSLVTRKEAFPESIITDINKTTTLYSNRIGFSKKSFYFNTEYVYKSPDAIIVKTDVDYNFTRYGNAWLVNFGYSKKGFGFDTSLRRLENMLFLSERQPEVYSPENTSINYNDRIMNYLPSLTKQHHSNLANIYVYQAQARTAMQFDERIEKFGEIGGQLDLFYDFKKGTTLGGKYGTKIAVNASSWFNLAADFTYFDQLNNYRPDYTTKLFKGNQKYFSDYNIEISKKISPKVSGVLSYINQYYNDQYIRGIFTESVVKSNILAAESTILFKKSKSITISAEHMWADSDRKNWVSAMLEYNHNANWSIFAMDMYNYGFDENEHLINDIDKFDIHFYNFGTAYKKGSTRIALNYGRQRGGLVCAGGVCRFVPPSTGLGLQISTTF